MRRSTRVLAFTILLLSLLFSSTLYAAAPRPPVFVVIADYLSIQDLKEVDRPNINKFLSRGAVGLTSVTPVKRRSPESIYASSAAGVSVRGTPEADSAYSVAEEVSWEKDTAANVFARRTGQKTPDGGVVNLGTPALQKINEQDGRSEMIGLLGRCFHKAGKKVAVFGNSDRDTSNKRLAAILGADELGRIPVGDVSHRMLKKTPESATGWVTDVGRLHKAITDAAGEADLVIADFGDTTRLYLARNELTLRAHTKYYHDTLDRLDDLLGRLMLLADKLGSRVFFISFIPPEVDDHQWYHLPPVAVYGRGPGLISSQTTRRAGLVTGTDLMPTLLQEAGIEVPAVVIGRPYVYKKSKESLTYLASVDRRVVSSNVLEWPMLSGAAIIGGLAITLSSCMIAFRRRLRRSANLALRIGLVLAVSLFGGLLLQGLGGETSEGQLAAVALGSSTVLLLSFLFAFAAGRLTGKESMARFCLPMTGAFLILAGLVIFDGLTGGWLNLFCIAGYMPTSGFRFYGIGNEYMGVLIGSLFTALLWLTGKPGKRELSGVGRAVILLLFTSAVVVLGWPGWGANAGGAIAAIVAFGLAYRAVSKAVFRLTDTAALLMLSMAVLVVLSVVDSSLNGAASSHIGFAASTVSRGGWHDVVEMAIHKAGMNLSLIGMSHSRTAILGFTPFFALWVVGVWPRVRELAGHYPTLLPGLAAGLTGAVAAFIFNDSGIVSASIILAMIICALLYSLLQEEAGCAAHNGS